MSTHLGNAGTYMRVLWTAVVYMCVVSHWYITIHDRDVSKKGAFA